MSGLLGDTSARDYSRKLRLFNDFATPELRLAVGAAGLAPGMRVLDVGCGTGEALQWLHEAIAPGGLAIGMDLSAAHTGAARARSPPAVSVLQADLSQRCLAPRSFDLVWSVNTVNHFRDPQRALTAIRELLRPRGRIAVGQSALLPDLLFAWDARLERLTHEAVRRYYEARYALTEHDLSGARNLLGWVQQAGFREIRVRTIVIERLRPLRAADEAYLLEAIFRGTWGERLRPYLPSEDYQALCELCDPRQPAFALRRADFHFLQTLTLITGEVPP